MEQKKKYIQQRRIATILKPREYNKFKEYCLQNQMNMSEGIRFITRQFFMAKEKNKL